MSKMELGKEEKSLESQQSADAMAGEGEGGGVYLWQARAIFCHVEKLAGGVERFGQFSPNLTTLLPWRGRARSGAIQSAAERWNGP